MTLTINQKDFSFSPDTLTAIGDKPYCNILIQPKEQLLRLFFPYALQVLHFSEHRQSLF